MNKKLLTVITAGAVFATASCANDNHVEQENYQKDIYHVSKYPTNIPTSYNYVNWDQKAIGYDSLVFDYNETGHEFFPLIWEDETYNSYGIAAYIGDGRRGNDGHQEGVTNIAAVLSATLNGVDKSNQDGNDFVDGLLAFYSPSEGIILNNPAGSSATTSLWYLLYPTILFSQVAEMYPEKTVLMDRTMSTIERWYQAYEVMWDNGNGNFDYTYFDFTQMKPVKNGIWTEPDSAVGLAMLFYYAYEQTGDNRYVDAAINCMDYIEDYKFSPMYEVLLYYSPYLAAKLNAKHGTNYDLNTMFDDMFNGGGLPRGGWGAMNGTWGGYEVNGLMGSISDGGGYAFAMNTFAAGAALAPTIKYDPRYASDIGKWMLHASSNARYFFANETPANNQSCTYIEKCDGLEELGVYDVVPYEGIRKEQGGKTPWFGGDPTVYGWAETDLSLYSGSHIGIFSSLFDETNVEGILKIDTNVSDYYTESYPTYSMYNPHDVAKTVNYEISTNKTVDLYNAITKEVIATGVSGTVPIEIDADDSVVIVELENNSTIVQEGLSYYVNGTYIATDALTVQILNVSHNQVIDKKFKLQLYAKTYKSGDGVKSVKVTIGDKVYTFDSIDNIEIPVKDLVEKAHILNVEVEMESGLKDYDQVRVIVE